jgi:hypothetical protein
MFIELSQSHYRQETRAIARFIPNMPNIEHWFRRYVIVDLGRILQSIECSSIPKSHREFFRVVFASIIRNCSNADPVPVSGLEVTAHMKRRDKAGRLINPFEQFSKAISKAVAAAREFYDATQPLSSGRVFQGDATWLQGRIKHPVDAIITSPPYHGAVDYYRRHKLEMFWLGLTKSQTDRLRLIDKYIGRPRVPQRDVLLTSGRLSTALAQHWDERIRGISGERANAFRHYILSMTGVFDALAPTLPSEAPAIFVVGHSTWNSAEIPTTSLFQEIAGDRFTLDEVFNYPLKNRYMSYSRHNDADIKTEYVLVFRRNHGRGPA